MTIFDTDLDAILKDFSVQVVSDSGAGFGILDKSDEVLNDFTLSTDYVLTVKTIDFGSLVFGDTLTVDGVDYEIKEIRKIDDGLLSKVFLSKI